MPPGVVRLIAALAASVFFVGCGSTETGSGSTDTGSNPSGASSTSSHTTRGAATTKSAVPNPVFPKKFCSRFAAVQHVLAPAEVLDTKISGPLTDIHLEIESNLMRAAKVPAVAVSGYSCETTPTGELAHAAGESSIAIAAFNRALSEAEGLRQLTYASKHTEDAVSGVGDWAFFDTGGSISEGPVVTFAKGVLLVKVQGKTDLSKATMIAEAKQVFAILP